MNRSGQAIRAVTDWFKLPPQSVLVIYDDMDCWGRSPTLIWFSWGHNGMKARSHTLATKISPPNRHRQTKVQSDDPAAVSLYVGRFSAAETQLMSEVPNSWLSA